jgi:alpha/beta superfamily hydrolase
MTHKNPTDVLLDINTLESANQFIVITDHENEFYYCYPQENEFVPLKGKNFVSRSFIPITISIHQEVGSFFVYKWKTLNEVVNHFDLLFNS